jgi:alkaline phosphatase D
MHFGTRTGWLALAALALGLGLTDVRAAKADAAAKPPASAKYSVNLGPMIGGVTPASATVWARLSGATGAYIAYRTLDAGQDSQSQLVNTSTDSDFTFQIPLNDLQPDTEYRYQVMVGQPGNKWTASNVFYFHTAPPSPQTLTFNVMADFMVRDEASQALISATTPRPDFLAVIGDMDHRGPAIDPNTKTYYTLQQTSTVLSNMRKMRRDMRAPSTPIGNNFVQGIMASPDPSQPQIPLYYVWDDHDFCANNSDATCPFSSTSLQVYREYFVSAADNGTQGGDCGQSGDWQSLPVGNLGTVFLLDSRSQRDEAGGTTMLGTCQLSWLLNGLLNAPTTWKIVLSPVTFNPTTKPNDGWGHFVSEHDQIVAFVRDNNIQNVIVLSGDIHSGGAIDDGTHAGLPEVSVPHANMPWTWVDTYCKVDRENGVNTLTSEPGTWTAGGFTDPNIGGEPHQCLGKFYKDSVPVSTLPPPPYPLPGANNPGYASVQLTPVTATVRVLDQNGNQRSGFLADGTQVDLVLNLLAQ